MTTQTLTADQITYEAISNADYETLSKLMGYALGAYATRGVISFKEGLSICSFLDDKWHEHDAQVAPATEETDGERG